MLVALHEGKRVVAAIAEKGPKYYCPGCNQEVIIKKGIKVIHHFAHKPPVTCSWSVGETREHLTAKSQFHDYFSKIGLRSEVEYPLSGCRADVYVHGMNMVPNVFELQHTPISELEIIRRTQHYFSLNIAMNWFPLINISKIKNCYKHSEGVWIERYAPKQYERWLHGFNYGEIWYFDPHSSSFWLGKFRPCTKEVPYNSWYGEGGEAKSAGGYTKILKKYKNLYLYGPFNFTEVRIFVKKREQGSYGGHSYPGGYHIKLSPISA